MRNYLRLIMTLIVAVGGFSCLNAEFEYLLNKSSSDWATRTLLVSLLLTLGVMFFLIVEIWKTPSIKEHDDGWILMSEKEPPLHCEVLFTDRVPGETPKVMKDIYDKHRISNIGHGVYAGNGMFTTYHLMDENDEPLTEKATHWRFLPEEPNFDN